MSQSSEIEELPDHQSVLVHGQQKRKPASAARLSLCPYFSARRLDQPLRNCQSQSHPRRIAIDTHEVFENLLVMFCRNSRSTIRDRNLNAIGPWQAKPPSLLDRRDFGHSPLPEMGTRMKRYRATCGSVL